MTTTPFVYRDETFSNNCRNFWRIFSGSWLNFVDEYEFGAFGVRLCCKILLNRLNMATGSAANERRSTTKWYKTKTESAKTARKWFIQLANKVLTPVPALPVTMNGDIGPGDKTWFISCSLCEWRSEKSSKCRNFFKNIFERVNFFITEEMPFTFT